MINKTQLSDNIISALYPIIPDPPLPNPLNLSAYEGTYTHPAYPDLRVSSSCPKRGRVFQGLNRSVPDLCASFVKYNEYTRHLVIDLFHVSGTFWIQIAAPWELPSAARVEFRVDSKGSVSWLGVEAEPLMAVYEKKIWWKHF